VVGVGDVAENLTKDREAGSGLSAYSSSGIFSAASSIHAVTSASGPFSDGR
jgi:hypothetical protein